VCARSPAERVFYLSLVLPWPAVPHYDAYISEPIGLDKVRSGEDYTEFMDASWSGEADSPEAAEANVRAAWRAKYDDDPPAGAEIKVTPGPLVCLRCEGRGRLERYATGIDPGPNSPLGSARDRKCPDCAGTGNITQRR
jgi:hypothetical protein